MAQLVWFSLLLLLLLRDGLALRVEEDELETEAERTDKDRDAIIRTSKGGNPFAKGGNPFAKGRKKLKRQKPPQQIRRERECKQMQKQLASPDRNMRIEGATKTMMAKWQHVTCPTGVTVKFVKADTLSTTLTNAERNLSTMMAFDLDGTLEEMKTKDTTDTLSVFRGPAKAFEKVVVTATSATKRNCETIIAQLNRPAEEDAANAFASLLPAPRAQTCRTSNVVDVNGTRVSNTPMFIAPSIAMNGYEKAQAVITYLQCQERLTKAPPAHIIFYDDFVTNPINFANHFCFNEAPAGLQKVTAVWFATQEAQQRSRTKEARLRQLVADCDPSFDLRNFPSEGSYFSAEISNDAHLAACRAIFANLGSTS